MPIAGNENMKVTKTTVVPLFKVLRQARKARDSEIITSKNKYLMIQNQQEYLNSIRNGLLEEGKGFFVGYYADSHQLNYYNTYRLIYLPSLRAM